MNNNTDTLAAGVLPEYGTNRCGEPLVGKSTHEQVDILEASMRKMPEDTKIDIDSCTKHYFADGCYVRSIEIKAGGTIVGKLHRKECINILAKGKVAVVGQDGIPVILEAPFVFVAPPYTKKAAYVLEDMIWLNVHPNAENTKDLNVLEQQIIEPNNLLENKSFSLTHIPIK